MEATSTTKQEEHSVAPRNNAVEEEANTGVLSLFVLRMGHSCTYFALVQRPEIVLFNKGQPPTAEMSVVLV